MDDFLGHFGVVDSSEVKKIDEILDKLNGWVEDLDLIKSRLTEQLNNSDKLSSSDIKSLTSLIKTMANLIELYGRYTGDLKNHNVNMNINMDYKDALLAYVGIFNEVAPLKVKSDFLVRAKERGLIYER